MNNLAEVGDVELTKEWYGTHEVARLLGVSPFAVWYWCKTGKIQAGRTPSGRYRIPRKEVERLLNELNSILL